MWMWCCTHCPFSSRFWDFSKKSRHHWNSLQHMDSISVSLATQCVHLHHQFTPAGPCSGSSSYRLSLSPSVRSCSWLLLFALQGPLCCILPRAQSHMHPFWAANFWNLLVYQFERRFSRGLTQVSRRLTELKKDGRLLLYLTHLHDACLM